MRCLSKTSAHEPPTQDKCVGAICICILNQTSANNPNYPRIHVACVPSTRIQCICHLRQTPAHAPTQLDFSACATSAKLLRIHPLLDYCACATFTKPQRLRRLHQISAHGPCMHCIHQISAHAPPLPNFCACAPSTKLLRMRHIYHASAHAPPPPNFCTYTP
jgi:hypothetical protein